MPKTAKKTFTKLSEFLKTSGPGDELKVKLTDKERMYPYIVAGRVGKRISTTNAKGTTVITVLEGEREKGVWRGKGKSKPATKGKAPKGKKQLSIFPKGKRRPKNAVEPANAVELPKVVAPSKGVDLTETANAAV